MKRGAGIVLHVSDKKVVSLIDFYGFEIVVLFSVQEENVK